MSGFKLAPYWKTEHTQALLDLKTAITLRPVVQGPQYDRSPFILTSDRCTEGFMEVLSQKVRTQTPQGRWVKKLHPIGFTSKRTSMTEQ
ncbi:hypothetical protein BDR06DRAFT_900646 [Suillus hirtellus]|nr:hypothetical protein BDR06DRAFT_900646 [Suillus hirtellus]